MIIAVIEILVVVLALLVGARYGSLALGAISGIGLGILVFGFGLTPGTPPIDVIFIIIAAITCAATLQASGGMNWMVQIAERLMRKHPGSITFFAPLCTFFLTVLIGTGHAMYTLMPIIADISLKKGIRPERPCAVASIASQVGIVCSPISAAVVAFVTISAENGVALTIPQVLMCTMPASIIGILAASLLSFRRGRELSEDPQFQALIADPEGRLKVYGEDVTALGVKVDGKAKASVYVFLAALLCIIMMGAFKYSAVKMSTVIQIIMLIAAALMIIFCRTRPSEAVEGSVFKSGMVAVVAIFGIAWMSDTLFSNYTEQIKLVLGGIVSDYPWAIALVFFAVSVLINSQGAAVVALLPLAYSLGIPWQILLGVFPCVYGYFFIPTYPSDIATVNFDRSGTTRIGKYLLNHSFMMPGLVAIAVSTGLCLFLSHLFFA